MSDWLSSYEAKGYHFPLRVFSEHILGPNILVWNSSFFIKEPKTKDFISWHQDLTYWGLTDNHEVTVEHRDTFAENNLLSRGQELAVEVDEQSAVNVVLEPGEMSLHHGQVFHGSHANQSDDRRIGLAIRYITPDMKQSIADKTNATLVSGVDEFNHFNLCSAPNGTMHTDDIEAVKRDITVKETFLMAGVER